MFVDYPQQFCENGNNGSIFSRSTLILLDTLISNFNTPGTLIFPDTLIFPYLHPCMTPPSCFQLPSFGTFPFFLRLLPAPSVLVFLYLVTLYLFTFRLPVFFALLFRTYVGILNCEGFLDILYLFLQGTTIIPRFVFLFISPYIYSFWPLLVFIPTKFFRTIKFVCLF